MRLKYYGNYQAYKYNYNIEHYFSNNLLFCCCYIIDTSTLDGPTTSFSHHTCVMFFLDSFVNWGFPNPPLKY